LELRIANLKARRQEPESRSQESEDEENVGGLRFEATKGNDGIMGLRKRNISVNLCPIRTVGCFCRFPKLQFCVIP
jgi:hypothetical protein